MRGPHSLFVVIWLPRTMDVDTALSLRRKHDVVVGLARTQTKLGLRALKKHEAVLAKAIYPDKDVAVCQVVEVGPLPHGLTHTQVEPFSRHGIGLPNP